MIPGGFGDFNFFFFHLPTPHSFLGRSLFFSHSRCGSYCSYSSFTWSGFCQNWKEGSLMNASGYLNYKGGSASWDCSAGSLVENKPAKATYFLPDDCADLPPWRKTCFHTRGKAQEQWGAAGGGRQHGTAWPSVDAAGHTGDVSQGSKQERKVSWDCNSELCVKTSQAACELTLPWSIQGTSGGLDLSWLLLAASPLLSSLCQTLNSECSFIFQSSFLEEAESGFSFLCRSQEQSEKIYSFLPFQL